MTKHAALPGFRDFHPAEMVRRRQVFAAWHDVARRYGFEEYDGPPLESLGLFVEKSGPEIVNQLFNFTDKGGREVALRPEMTPTLVRMLGSAIKALPRPVRWYSTPQLFRYEKQQRGRLREHFQLNMDIVGEESVLADADLVCAALDVMRTLGLTAEDVVARISDRRLLHHALVALGVPAEKLPVAYNVIDKVERDPHDLCVKRLEEIGLDRASAEKALAMTGLTISEMRERFGSIPEVEVVLTRLDEYFSAIASLGFSEWVQFDMKIVRGLAYYTGIVFELFDRRGELRAICGGGRYDNLFAGLAGIDVAALGFGMGDVVLGELLQVRKLAASPAREVDVYVIAADEPSRAAALSVAGTLRESGKSVVFAYKPTGVVKGLKAAAAAGAKEAYIIGSRELESGNIVIRDLAHGSESTVSLASIQSGNR